MVRSSLFLDREQQEWTVSAAVRGDRYFYFFFFSRVFILLSPCQETKQQNLEPRTWRTFNSSLIASLPLFSSS